MESAVALRSFHRSANTISQAWSSLETHGTTAWPITSRSLAVGKLNVSPVRHPKLVSCAKTAEVSVSSKSNDSSSAVSTGKHNLPSATFPNLFEALVLEVCDETSVAELKLKVGDMEMHLKRNIGATSAPVSVSAPAVSPPIPSEPMNQSAPTKSPPEKSSAEGSTFANLSTVKPPKLAALEASGSSGYKLIPSPTVGSFRRGRTVKGKRQPPMCKEGDLIKEGQVIGYVDQFGTELPVKSDVAGEVVKLLFDEGGAVGYGDPLIAVLPSFGIN